MMLAHGQEQLSHGYATMTPPNAIASVGSVQNDIPSTPRPAQHIWIITGPAGCGKSTVGQYLTAQLGLPLIEGDDYHPPENIKKMESGIPLHDADRWDWLINLRQHCVEQLRAGVSGVVLTCSALKRKYRDVIRIASYYDHNIFAHFLYLRAEQELLLRRVKGRKGHYMKDDMVQSQFKTLEEPGLEERDCLFVDVSGTVVEVEQLVLKSIQELMEPRNGHAMSHSPS